jgi:hypothetical protein
VSSYEQSRQLKKLSLKLQYLREENQDVQDDLDVGKWELNLAVLEAFARSGQKINTGAVEQATPPDPPAADSSEDLAPSDPVCKKLFRKIAVIAHPDKLLDADDGQRFHLEELYRQAAAAAKEGDRAALIEIAASLDIEIDVDPELQIAAMSESAASLEKSISSSQQTLPYVWTKSREDSSRRADILRAVVNHMGAEITDEVISGVLQWIVAGFPGGTSYGSDVEVPKRRVPPPRPAGVRPEKVPKRRK